MKGKSRTLELVRMLRISLAQFLFFTVMDEQIHRFIISFPFLVLSGFRAPQFSFCSTSQASSILSIIITPEYIFISSCLGFSQSYVFLAFSLSTNPGKASRLCISKNNVITKTCSHEKNIQWFYCGQRIKSKL